MKRAGGEGADDSQSRWNIAEMAAGLHFHEEAANSIVLEAPLRSASNRLSMAIEALVDGLEPALHPVSEIADSFDAAPSMRRATFSSTLLLDALGDIESRSRPIGFSIGTRE